MDSPSQEHTIDVGHATEFISLQAITEPHTSDFLAVITSIAIRDAKSELGVDVIGIVMDSVSNMN